MRIGIVEEFIGSTLRTTWVNSGVTYTQGYSALFSVDSTLVNSVAHVSSGNGFYYADHPLPTSRCSLVNEQCGVTATNTYRRYQQVNVLEPDPRAS